MPEFVQVSRLSDIPAGTMSTVTVGDVEILLSNVDGRIYESAAVAAT